ncbi:MAG: sensor domain-containing diguanylate cyclase [Cyanobacteria bacterium P01_H01_bin.119]
MQRPALPINEVQRLKALRALNLLDTPPEERFDRFTRIAKRLFNVPTVLVSLIDENRQWFKSCIGLELTESPRDTSFCGHTILGDHSLIVPDAIRDERFFDNPLVVAPPFIRFYAGHPLQLPNGLKLGTFCLIDNKTRGFSVRDIAALKDLAACIEREIVIFQLATVDDLTGIINRRGFIRFAQERLNLCRRKKLHAALVFIDLNKFKSINDGFGHAEGDRVLIAFANLLQISLRESDIFARLGGDEFAVLLTDATVENAKSAMSNLQNSLRTQALLRKYSVTFSYGAVPINAENPSSLETLLAESDRVMYHHKKRLSALL